MARPPINDVSDTAYWIAHHRAVESARNDALFRDPFAGRLAGEHGRKIAAGMPHSRMIGWSIVMRTCIIDEFVQAAVSAGADTILNLGAGLDTRPYRMALPKGLRWIEADYPHIIEYKQALLTGERAHCQLERVKIDLANGPDRRKLFSDVNARANRILVLTEGVIPYLNLQEAALLADDLRATAHICCWLVDYFSPQAMKFRQRRGMERAMRNAPFRFYPGDWFAFFEQHGWRAAQTRYFVDEGQRRNRPIPLSWHLTAVLKIWGAIAPTQLDALRKFAGYVLLEPR
jgi:methyltransferase (TIGR00027 family)